jgi:uncharacterized BrkB/YihY/UPF0761 family membrane protein
VTYPAPATPPVAVPPATTRRPVRVWDIVVTVVLVVLLGILALFASYFGLFFSMASDGCFDDNCNYDLLTFGVWFAVISPWVLLLITIGVAVTLLIRRRLAFWVPLAGAALTIVGFFVAVAIVGAAVGT